MDKKSLKVKIFLNLFGAYKEVSQVADITTTLQNYCLQKVTRIFSEKVPLDCYFNICQINPKVYEHLDKNDNIMSSKQKQCFGNMTLISE